MKTKDKTDSQQNFKRNYFSRDFYGEKVEQVSSEYRQMRKICATRKCQQFYFHFGWAS